MKLKAITLSAFLAAACTSNDEQPAPAADEPVAAESAELTDPAKQDTPAEPAPEAGAEAKTDEVITEKSVSPGVDAAPAPAPATPATGANEEPGEGLYVAVSHLNVRSGPGMQHLVVGVVDFNSQHVSLGTENRIWIKIGEGRYISRKYLSEQKLTEPMAVSAQQNPAPQAEAAAQESAPADQSPAEQAPAEQAPAEQAPEDTNSGQTDTQETGG